MTEQEAKLKPCIGPAPQNTGELWNPGGDGVTRFGCAGSTCLAWRQDEPFDHRKRYLWSKSKGARVSGAVGNDGEWRLENPDEPMPAAHGWCGWIGKP